MEDKAMLPTIRRSFNPFFSGLFDDDFFPVAKSSSTLPAVNIRESDKDFILELAVPGIDKKDLNIDISDDVLTISHETKTTSEVDQADGYKRKEFSYSSFCRSFYIPENVLTDKIGANYKDGILTVELPKDREEKQKLTKQVKIS